MTLDDINMYCTILYCVFRIHASDGREEPTQSRTVARDDGGGDGPVMESTARAAAIDPLAPSWSVKG